MHTLVIGGKGNYEPTKAFARSPWWSFTQQIVASARREVPADGDLIRDLVFRGPGDVGHVPSPSSRIDVLISISQVVVCFVLGVLCSVATPLAKVHVPGRLVIMGLFCDSFL